MKDLILGIESSCDDSCACLMSFVDGHIEYNKSIHQDEVHSKFGGIVPNLASGEHLKHFEILLEELKKQDIMRIACVATTTGPGLIGSLLVGVSFAKGIAMSLGIPLLRINHLEGHILSCMIENDVKFPFLILLVSGGNSQIILAKKLGEYEIIGQTLDDAGGEALDKIAKNLDIGYPGGINLEKCALKWSNSEESKKRPCRFNFKDGSISNKTYNFSFSGLKTQIMYKVKELGGIEKLSLLEQQGDLIKSEIAFAGQEAVFDTLTKKIKQVLKTHQEVKGMVNDELLDTLVVCGGVSANKTLSKKMNVLANEFNLKLIVPSLQYTTDNACMIAKVGCIRWNEWKNNKRDLGYNNMDLSFSPMAKWEIDKVEDVWKII